MKPIIMSAILCVCLAAGVTADDPIAYVINTTGETLSRINLSDNAVDNNIEPLGSADFCYPNQIKIRDTLAYILNSGTAEIQIYDIKNETTVDWIFLPAGSNPYWMDFLNDQYLYVTLFNDNSLAKVDVTTNSVVLTTTVGLSPEGVMYHNDKIYVAVTGYNPVTYGFEEGYVVVYDPVGDTVIIEIEVGTNPQYMDRDSQGRIHVACSGCSWCYPALPSLIYVIDSDTDALVDSFTTGGNPGGIAITDEDVAFLAAGGWAEDGEVYSYDALTFDLLRDYEDPIYVDSGAFSVVAFGDSTIFVGTFSDRVFRINSAGETVNTYILGDGPIHFDFNYKPGDANADFTVNIADASRLINWIFFEGADLIQPAWRANANADPSINIADASYLINYIFFGGGAPIVGPAWIDGD